MPKLINTEIGLVDKSDIINITVGWYNKVFESIPTICLYKKGKLWKKKKYIYFEDEECRDKVYQQILNGITID